MSCVFLTRVNVKRVLVLYFMFIFEPSLKERAFCALYILNGFKVL